MNLGIDENANEFWMPEYWDRFVRDEDHFYSAVQYILNNPTKANLQKNHTAYLYRGWNLDNGLSQGLHPTQLRLVMTRSKDDEKELWDMLGNKDERKELERQFKNPKSNFKIAIVVDMWLTGFDVPFLDTIYIDKPLQQHNLIQTILDVKKEFSLGDELGIGFEEKAFYDILKIAL